MTLFQKLKWKLCNPLDFLDIKDHYEQLKWKLCNPLDFLDIKDHYEQMWPLFPAKHRTVSTLIIFS